MTALILEKPKSASSGKLLVSNPVVESFQEPPFISEEENETDLLTESSQPKVIKVALATGTFHCRPLEMFKPTVRDVFACVLPQSQVWINPCTLQAVTVTPLSSINSLCCTDPHSLGSQYFLGGN